MIEIYFIIYKNTVFDILKYFSPYIYYTCAFSNTVLVSKLISYNNE